MNKLLTTILLLFITSSLFSQERYWIARQSANWNDANNWATSANGTGGASIPKTTDKVFFKGSDKGDCIINTNINILGIECSDNYNATVFFNSNQINIGNQGLNLKSGTIDASSSTVSIDGNFYSEADFQSTTQEITFKENFTILNPGNYTHNTGKSTFIAKSTNAITGKSSFSDLKIIANTNNDSIIINDTIFVHDQLILDESQYDFLISGGQVSVFGDITGSNHADLNTAIELYGGQNQRILKNDANPLSINKMIVNKPSGSASVYCDLEIENELILSNGTLKINTDNEIILNQNTSITGQHQNAYINGTILKKGNQDFTFPIGNNQQYLPITISNISTYTEISCTATDKPNNVGKKDSTLVFINKDFSWLLESNNAQAVDVVLYPDQYTSKSATQISQSDAKIIKNTNQNWQIIQNQTNLDDQVKMTNFVPDSEIGIGADQITLCSNAPLYWVGKISDDWNEALNWSKTSGGAGGTVLPCQNSTVIFDGNSNPICKLTSDVELSKVLVLSDFDGEIQANNYTITIKELFK